MTVQAERWAGYSQGEGDIGWMSHMMTITKTVERDNFKGNSNNI